MSYDRDTKTDEIELIADPVERAEKEAENGVRQFKVARKIIATHIAEPKPRPIRQAMVMEVHRAAMLGVHPLAGTFRNTGATIGVSRHIPPPPSEIGDHLAEMVQYLNDHWEEKSATHLAAYAMWRLNWIHPFADGNGRTSRMLSYMVLSMKMLSILPGSPTIPDQISENRRPEYYSELERADESWALGLVHMARIEAIMEEMLEVQLQNALSDAAS